MPIDFGHGACDVTRVSVVREGIADRTDRRLESGRFADDSPHVSHSEIRCLEIRMQSSREDDSALPD